MFNGRIAGLERRPGAGRRGRRRSPPAGHAKAELLKSHPGKIEPQVLPAARPGVLPVIHCLQEIPCNPCSTVCPTSSIQLEGDPLMGLPRYDGATASAAPKCVADLPRPGHHPGRLPPGPRASRKSPSPTRCRNLPLAGATRSRPSTSTAAPLGEFEVARRCSSNRENLTQLVRLRVPAALAKRVVSFRIQPSRRPRRPAGRRSLPPPDGGRGAMALPVRAGLGRRGAPPGAPGHHRHQPDQGRHPRRHGRLRRQVLRDADPLHLPPGRGCARDRSTPDTKRPLFVEVPLGTLAGRRRKENEPWARPTTWS